MSKLGFVVVEKASSVGETESSPVVGAQKSASACQETDRLAGSGR